ncbi:uncharacterized protein LOC131952938 [Physella acuta]|uniref:uncharacterized protein LOC131952938 n=1 Tax=Physella acuta TaxID=109671 RepID=UPI0027DC0988|nr:uncharacterized protein LOC131952938 [Physella acuta]
MEPDKKTACQPSVPSTEKEASNPLDQPEEDSFLICLLDEFCYILDVLLPTTLTMPFFFLWMILTAFAAWQVKMTIDYFEICELLMLKEISRRLIVRIVLVYVAYRAQFYLVNQFFDECVWKFPTPLPKEELRAIRQEGSYFRELRKKRDRNIKDSPVLTLKLDEVIRRYAWQAMLKECDEDERYNLESIERTYKCQLDWSVLGIEHKVTKFSPKVKDGSEAKLLRDNVKPGTRWVTLWEGNYDNRTEGRVTHAFSGSRDTTTWVDVDLKQCYTVKKQVCGWLSLPQYLQVGIDKALNLNKVKGEVFQKVHTWEINTQVEVEPSSRAHAQLLARQECSVAEFEIRTTFPNRKGLLPVTFKGNIENDILYDVNIENLLEAFRPVEEGGVLKPEEKACVELVVEKWLDKDGVEHSTSHPQIITRGSCVYLSWTDQKVDIKTSPLSTEESIDEKRGINKVPVNHADENPSANAFVVVD